VRSPAEPRAAAEEVIRAHGPRIRSYLLGLLRDRDLADDAYSLFCEWTLDAVARFRGTSPVRTWAYGVAHNAARRVRADAYRRRRCSLSRAGVSRARARSGSSALRRERAAALVEAIRASLTLDEQGLLALRVDGGLEWNEIAEILSSGPNRLAPAALRKRFERLKDRIRRLASEGGAVD
jgi:RNA polymerase sigma-70 factor (ECF subfamily)